MTSWCGSSKPSISAVFNRRYYNDSNITCCRCDKSIRFVYGWEVKIINDNSQPLAICNECWYDK